MIMIKKKTSPDLCVEESEGEIFDLSKLREFRSWESFWPIVINVKLFLKFLSLKAFYLIYIENELSLLISYR